MAMHKDEALILLMGEARDDSGRQPGKTRAARIVRACNVLGVEGESLKQVLRYLDMIDSEGNPFNPNIKRTW
jgi:hypothetical protein